MPHITLIYPFRPVAEFEALNQPLVEACGGLEPFDVALAEFRTFRHRRDNYTMWLRPEPEAPLAALHAILQGAVDPLVNIERDQRSFQPHLSVGQVRGKSKMNTLVTELQAKWKPVRFGVQDVSLIYRNEPPDDGFRVAETIAFGTSC
jgi:2'-5' RNA ligase